jgi:hypothetical protein
MANKFHTEALPAATVYSLLTSQPHRFAVEGASAGGYQNYFCESGWMKPVAFHISTLDNRQQSGTEHFFYRSQFLPLVRY